MSKNDFIILNILFSLIVVLILSEFANGQDIPHQLSTNSQSYEDALTLPNQQNLTSTIPSDVEPVFSPTENGISCGIAQDGCTSGECFPSNESGCPDNLFTRTRLTNGLFGLQPALAENGIIADLQMTQFFQGVSSGGKEQRFNYGGKLDYNFTFLGGKLGLNEGFTAMMHAETRYGEDANADAGALALPNANMLYPNLGYDGTSITGLFFMQMLNEKIALTAGKYNGLDLFNMIYPNTGRGIEGFMNVSFLIPPTLSRTTNLSINGGGLLAMKGKQIQSALLLYDTNNSTTTIAPDLFDQGVVVLGYHRIFTKFGGLPGSQGFLGNYSNRTYTSTDPLSWAIIPGQGIVAGKKTGSWTFSHFGDQMLWIDSSNEKRNVRLFSILSIADGKTNPYRWSGAISLEASGLIPSREADKMGVGYFYNGLSNDFKRLVNTLPPVNIQDVQGVELYYNAAITPWFHLTADLQVIDNQNVSDKTAIVPGLRANLRF